MEGHGDVKRSQFTLNTIEQPELLYMHGTWVFVASVFYVWTYSKGVYSLFLSSPLVAYAFAAQFTHL